MTRYSAEFIAFPEAVSETTASGIPNHNAQVAILPEVHVRCGEI